MVRFGSKDVRQLVREASSEGWTAEVTPGGHVKLTHPEASGPVFCPQTPSDFRSLDNTRADMRRALRGEQPNVVELNAGELMMDAYRELGAPDEVLESLRPRPVLNDRQRALLEMGWCADCGDREEQAAALSDAGVRRFTREMRASMEQDAAQDAPEAPGAAEASGAAPSPPERVPDAGGVWVASYTGTSAETAPWSEHEAYAFAFEIDCLRFAVKHRWSAQYVPFAEGEMDL